MLVQNNNKFNLNNKTQVYTAGLSLNPLNVKNCYNFKGFLIFIFIEIHSFA